MPDEVRATLLWLAELLIPLYAQAELAIIHVAPCVSCGHDRTHHRVGGDADDPTPWPCTFPQLMGAPASLCTCQDYETMRET
jgi:hypothetical protein